MFCRRTVYRLCFALFLLVPFFLREISPTLQPYPAILLPSGASTVEIENNQVSFNRIELLAVFPNHREVLLDPTEFFAPIPQQFGLRLARLRFGLGNEKKKSISNGLWTLTVNIQRSPTDAERAETIRWLRIQLDRIGISGATAICIRASLLTYDIVEQVEVKRKVIWENYVNLEM